MLHVSTLLPLKLSSLLQFFLRNCAFLTALSVKISLDELLAKCPRGTKIVPTCISISSVLCLLVVLLSLLFFPDKAFSSFFLL